MRYLTVGEVLDIYSRVMQQSGGLIGIRDLGALESAVAQPRMTFDGAELYPTLIENHPFLDGNKRTGHAALETLLVLNSCQISASVDEQVEIVLGVASGTVSREVFTAWLRAHITER